MSSLDRHKTLECSICRKMMRSNNLKRHWRSKHGMFDMELNIKVKSNTKVSGTPSTTNDLKVEILDNAKIYDEKIELGKDIFNVLMDTNTKEESLSRHHKEAFDMYQSKRLALNPDEDINLFPWQKNCSILSTMLPIEKLFG